MEEGRHYFRRFGYSEAELDSLHNLLSLVKDKNALDHLVDQVNNLRADFRTLSPAEKIIVRAAIGIFISTAVVGMVVGFERGMSWSKRASN